MPHAPQIEGSKLVDLTASIRDVGILLPIVRGADGTIVDGRARLDIATREGIFCPTVDLADRRPIDDLVVAASVHRARTQHRLDLPVDPRRRSLERILQVADHAADLTLPLQLRQVAASGISRIRGGSPAARVLEEVREAIRGHDVTSRYPELAGMDHDMAMRLAARLDTLTDDERDAERALVSVLSRGEGHESSAAVYRRIARLDEALDEFDTDAFIDEYEAAESAGTVTPMLRDRCLNISNRLASVSSMMRRKVGSQ